MASVAATWLLPEWAWAFLLVPIILLFNMALVTVVTGPYYLARRLIQKRRAERFPMDELALRRHRSAGRS